MATISQNDENEGRTNPTGWPTLGHRSHNMMEHQLQRQPNEQRP
jgi:hypothetical protein